MNSIIIPNKILNTNPNLCSALTDLSEQCEVFIVLYSHKDAEFISDRFPQFIDCLIKHRVRYATIVRNDRKETIRRISDGS